MLKCVFIKYEQDIEHEQVLKLVPNPIWASRLEAQMGLK